jgi:hypothetical protein
MEMDWIGINFHFGLRSSASCIQQQAFIEGFFCVRLHARCLGLSPCPCRVCSLKEEKVLFKLSHTQNGLIVSHVMLEGRILMGVPDHRSWGFRRMSQRSEAYTERSSKWKRLSWAKKPEEECVR